MPRLGRESPLELVPALQDSEGACCGKMAPNDTEQEPFPPAFPYDEVFGISADTKTPDGYRIDRDGVYVQLKGGGATWPKISFAPLIISATYMDANGDQSVELAWVQRGKVVRRMVDRGTARRGRELIKELGTAGLPVVESDAKPIERWLAEFEAANPDTIPHGYVARWLGWQPDGTFVSGPDEGVRVEVPYDDQKGPAKAHRRGGTFEGWQNGIAVVEAHPVPRVVIASALASALLRHLDVASFTVDVSSRSTRGKTTILQAALSVWANPGDDAEAIATWRTTMISIEKRLNLSRGIVTVLDETMTVESDEIISNVLYDLPKGVGKARSGGWPSRLQWETVLISTGERPALSYSTHQGAAARVLSTAKSPFGEGGGPVAVALRECALTHHGHAGPEFVAKLQELLQRSDGKTELRERHFRLTDQLRGATDMSGRRAPMVAVVALAEELACEWRILPYKALRMRVWQKLFTEVDDQTDNRPEMAMEVLRSYVASHSDHLYAGDPGAQQPHGGWLGKVEKGKKGLPDQVALAPDRVRKILEAANYSMDAVLEGWLDAGYLELSPSQRPAHLIKRRMGGGTQTKMVIFTPEAIDLGPGTDTQTRI